MQKFQTTTKGAYVPLFKFDGKFMEVGAPGGSRAESRPAAALQLVPNEVGLFVELFVVVLSRARGDRQQSYIRVLKSAPPANSILSSSWIGEPIYLIDRGKNGNDRLSQALILLQVELALLIFNLLLLKT